MILPLLLDMDQQDYLLQRLLHRLDMGLVLDMEHLGMLLDLLSLLLDMLILLDNLLNLHLEQNMLLALLVLLTL